MAKVYLRMSELIKAMEEDVNKGAKMLAEATTEYLYDKTQEKLYEKMSPGRYYKRTEGEGSLLNSITMEFISASNSYEIKFDKDSIIPKKAYDKDSGEGDKGFFNAHADFNFESVVENIVEWVEKGHYIPNKKDEDGNPKHREGAFMIRDTKNWLRNKIKTINSKTGYSFSDTVKTIL